jgi:hypothetical protein
VRASRNVVPPSYNAGRAPGYPDVTGSSSSELRQARGTTPSPVRSYPRAMSSPQPQSPGRAFLVYSALRLVLLVVAYSVLLAIGVDGLLAVGVRCCCPRC